MFKAGMVYRLQGEKALKQIKDPFGQGPFEFEKREKVFRLTSQIHWYRFVKKLKDKRVGLNFGGPQDY